MDDLRIKNKIKKDGWANLFSGLGTKADKRKTTRAVPNGFLMDVELETIYADDGLGARVIDLLPEDMMKQGWHYKFATEKEGFEENSYLVNDEQGIEDFGSSAYFVDEEWLESLEE